MMICLRFLEKTESLSLKAPKDNTNPFIQLKSTSRSEKISWPGEKVIDNPYIKVYNISMKHVAIYLRVSTTGIKNDREQDTAMQLLDIQNYLKMSGDINYSDFKIYEDRGHKGGTKERPALKEMMRDCRNGKVSMVICYKLDRLFRSLSFMLDHVTEFQSLGIEFVSVKDKIDLSSASGRLLFQVLSAFSEFEAATIRERVNSGLANAKAKGVKLGRPQKSGHGVVKKLRSEGSTVPEIANITGLSRQSVYRTLNKETL